MSSPKPFSSAIRTALPFGLVHGIHLPSVDTPMVDGWFKSLHPEEQAYAAALKAHKQISWIGGRLALRAAMKPLNPGTQPILSCPYGSPVLPPGLAASISHKKELAVAMVARSSHGTLGIDLEDLTPERPGIAERVLTASELEAVSILPPERQWNSVLLRFATKEALYKALFPHVVRYIAFQEATVNPGLNGDIQIELTLQHGEGPFLIEAQYYWFAAQVLCAVRILPAPQAPAN